MPKLKGPIGERTTPVPSSPLAPSSELLQVLVDTLSDFAIILLDEKGVVLTWNAAARSGKGRHLFRAPHSRRAPSCFRYWSIHSPTSPLSSSTKRASCSPGTRPLSGSKAGRQMRL